MLFRSFLDVSFTHFLLGGIESLVSGGVVFLLSSSDFIERHADNSLLDSGCSSGSLLLNIVDLNLLVEPSGGLGPGKLNWLDSLVEKGSSLGGDEKVDSAISSSEATSSTWVNFQFSECAGISLDNHLSVSIIIITK